MISLKKEKKLLIYNTFFLLFVLKQKINEPRPKNSKIKKTTTIMAAPSSEINITLPYEEENLQALKGMHPIYSLHDNTPLEWLKARIDQANAECPEKLKVVLLITGSMCPVHRMHLTALKVAGDHLESHYNYHVLGGFISPSNDKYVYGKLGDKAIPFVDRLNMCKLAVDELEFRYPVVVDSWEGSIPEFINFNYVRDHLSIAIRDRFPGEKILVLYVDGTDHFIKCGLKGWYKVATVMRPSNRENEVVPVTNLERHIYVCADTAGEDVSSTMIRERISAGESIDDLTFKSVVKYLDNMNKGKRKRTFFQW